MDAYILTEKNGVTSLTFFHHNKLVTFMDTDTNKFLEVVGLVRKGNNRTHEDNKKLDFLVSPRPTVESFIDASNSKVKLVGNEIVIVRSDGQYEKVNNSLVDKILAFKNQNLPFEFLLKFLENVLENPSYNSRKQLYEFLERGNLPITEDGCFIAYKATLNNGLSVNSGHGYVDGVEYTKAQLPNYIGAKVTIPRHEVDDNPDNHCSDGLHVGHYSYVNQYFMDNNRKIWLIKVNPKDVVSVPNDHDFTKMRVCAYEVLSEFDESALTSEFINTTKNTTDNTTQQQENSTEATFRDFLDEKTDTLRSVKSVAWKDEAEMVDECSKTKQLSKNQIYDILSDYDLHTIYCNSNKIYYYHIVKMMEYLDRN